MNDPDPRTQQVLDQAAAAAVDGIAFMDGFAENTSSQVEFSPPPPGTARALFRELLASRMETGQTVRCPHISSHAPQPMFWAPYIPETLNCAPCHERLMIEVTGTPEDDRCDQCRKSVPGEMHSCADHTPPLVVTGPGLRPAASGPILINFGLCPACYRRERKLT